MIWYVFCRISQGGHDNETRGKRIFHTVLAADSDRQRLTAGRGRSHFEGGGRENVVNYTYHMYLPTLLTKESAVESPADRADHPDEPEYVKGAPQTSETAFPGVFGVEA